MKAIITFAFVVLWVVSASADVRTWKDKTGKFSIRAELMEANETAVTLKRTDGKVIKVPLERLSDEGRQFLEAQEKNAFSDTAPAKSSSTKTPVLHYEWKKGQTYLYRVKIEADLGDDVVEMTGTPSYSVISADKDKTVVSFRGTLMEHERPKNPSHWAGPMRHGFIGPRMHPFSPMTGVGPFGMGRTTELTVDPHGNIARQEGTSQLPFLLGNLSHLMIEPLPDTAETTWTTSHDSGVIIKEGGLPHFGPRGNDEGFVPAVERTTYTIESMTDKLAVIHKQYEFRAAATGSDKPPFEITGDGKWTFSKAEGVSSDFDFSMKVSIRKGGLSIEIPVKATYHLIDEAERAAMAKAAKVNESEAKKPLSPKEITDVLADLHSGDGDRMTHAMQQLANKIPEKPNPELAKALADAATGSTSTMAKNNAAKALEKWSTAADVPKLLSALEDKSPAVRVSAIKALTKLKTQEAIVPVSKKLGDLFTRRPAVDFLKAMGPAAEPVVVKLLENLDPAVRREAAAVLKVIGTKESIPALEKATEDPDVFAKNNAKDALAAVRSR